MKTIIDYDKIYEYLETKENSQTVTAAMIAKAIGVKTINGGVMVKLADSGWVYKSNNPGFWLIADSIWEKHKNF